MREDMAAAEANGPVRAHCSIGCGSTPGASKRSRPGVEAVARLADPVGEVIDRVERPNGLVLTRVRVPIGVIGII